MQKYRRILGRRATLFLIDLLVIVLFLTAWIVAAKPFSVTTKPFPTERANNASDHILVQLAKLPEPSQAEMHTVQMWTLYGDGTLIFRTDPSDNLWRAQLSPREIHHILDVIINQDTFFDSTRQRYGKNTPEMDDDELLLTVDANGQQKAVVLMSEPTNQVASDMQTSNIFAIEQFLLDYHPLHSKFYAPNPDPDGDSDGASEDE